MVNSENMSNQNSFLTYLQAGAICATGLTLRMMPFPLAALAGTGVAYVYAGLSRRSPKFVECQMRATFGDRYSAAEYRALARDFFRHLGRLVAEGVRLRQLTAENIDEYVDWGPRFPALQQLLRESPVGCFFTTGHIGNWEFTGAACALKGLLVGSIARPLDNPLIDRLVNRYRENSGQRIWTKKGALTNILRAIRKKESIGILVDQDAGNDGVRVPFLGRPASTVTAIADLAIRTGAPIVPSAIQRTAGTMRFRANIGEFIIPDKKADPAQERLRILTALNAELSKIIESAPEQWLWSHRRWKTPNPAGADE